MLIPQNQDDIRHQLSNIIHAVLKNSSIYIYSHLPHPQNENKAKKQRFMLQTREICFPFCLL
ncbi:hypothetical protein J500_2017 [Acinetobacter sp. 479375]|nr:hypothetical protein J500_2017 [Acinetobacter sp. 479375]RSO85521.1 hypothetical protein EA748_02260 [Acinetobacter ursingii]